MSPGSKENSILPPTGTMSTDLLKLLRPRIVGNRLQAMLRRGSSGETYLASARLITVDHPSASEVFSINGEWRVGERQPALSVRGAHGEDLASLVSGDPGASLVGDTGDTIAVTLPNVADPGTTRVVYLDAQAGRVGDATGPGIALLEPGTDGEWQETARQMPRARFATMLMPGINGDQAKLVFAGNHAISAVGQIGLGGAAGNQSASPASVVHSRLGGIDPAVLQPGGAGLLLQAMDTVQIAFDLPTTAPAEARDYYLEVTGSSISGSAVAARLAPTVQDLGAPSRLTLDAPRPNPFAATTSMRLGIPQATFIRLEVFDLSGRRVAAIARERMAAGWHDLMWDGRTSAGGSVAPGIYVIRLAAGSRSGQQKVVVMR
jgi:hypothetical protein